MTTNIDVNGLREVSSKNFPKLRKMAQKLRNFFAPSKLERTPKQDLFSNVGSATHEAHITQNGMSYEECMDYGQRMILSEVSRGLNCGPYYHPSCTCVDPLILQFQSLSSKLSQTTDKAEIIRLSQKMDDVYKQLKDKNLLDIQCTCHSSAH